MQVLDIEMIRIAMPFIAVFTITFTLLRVSKILGSRKAISAIVSIGMGLLFLRNTYLIELMEKIGGKVALVVIALLFLIMIIVMFAGNENSKSLFQSSMFFKIILVAVFLIFVYITTSGIPGIDCEVNNFNDFWNCISDDYKKFIIFLTVVILVFIFSFWAGGKTKKGVEIIAEKLRQP